jgi:2-methylisocitrate lyase-like PEP mutase family enzyme
MVHLGPPSSSLADRAEVLRALHVPGSPLLLANVWDVASARVVADTGARALATTSAGVARAAGEEDHDSMGSDLAFAAVARIAAAVAVPVTADLERGYGLPPHDFASRLLAAGAVGCNLEDTDHHGPDVLVDVDIQAEFLHAVKTAARERGVDVVLNARVDVFARRGGEAAAGADEAIARARAYLDAGADCVYPILLADEAVIGRFVDAVQAPVNIYLRPGTPSVAELGRLGVARVSVGSSLARVALDATQRAAAGFLAGDPGPLFG